MRNAENLRQAAVAVWERIKNDPNSDMCWNMVTGMRNRLDEVLDANGGPTSY